MSEHVSAEERLAAHGDIPITCREVIEMVRAAEDAAYERAAQAAEQHGQGAKPELDSWTAGQFIARHIRRLKSSPKTT